MDLFDSHKTAMELRKKYPRGTELVLDVMHEPFHPVANGMHGKVDHIDDAGQIHMKWDNGRSLPLVPGLDEFHVAAEGEVRG